MPGPAPQKQFIINKNGVYYVTVGRVFVYDENATTDPGKLRKIKEVKDRFDTVRASPHTYYEAVEISPGTFSGGNTDEIT